MFLCFERVAFSSGRGFFFRCASFLKDTLCSYKSFFLCDQVLCSALASLPPCLLEIFTHKSGWHLPTPILCGKIKENTMWKGRKIRNGTSNHPSSLTSVGG